MTAPQPRAPRPWSRRAAQALGCVLLVTGSLHFVVPTAYESIVPGILGAPAFWVAASGVAELLCAVGLLVERTRRYAGIASAVLFVAVFPANVQMAVDAVRDAGQAGGSSEVVISLLRLPLQVPLVWWAVYAARPVRAAARR